jgi:hypothetical protein
MLFFWNGIMNDLKNSLEEQFEAPSFEEWKEDAQRYLKNIKIDDLLKKKLTQNIEIQSIYNSRPSNPIELHFSSSNESQTYSVSSDYYLESDLEVAHLLFLVSKSNQKELVVRVKIDPNFLLSIAKFRTLRYLLQESGIVSFSIEAYSSNLNKSVIDENNNIIRLTTEAMSAEIGGCDSLDMLPYNSLDSKLDSENSKFGSRLTQNIENLLNDESYFDKVTDPLAGSYLIEELTLKFVKSVKSYLNELDKLKNDNELDSYFSEKSKEYLNTIKERLDKGTKRLIGVNIYQNENRINNIGADEDRPASDFEQLKLKLDQNKPRVYVANFQEKSKLQLPITMAMNTFNIEFESNSLFELIEDGYNTIKLYDPDLVIVNGDDSIIRNLRNMLSEYSIVSIEEFSENSMLSNIELIISKMSKVNND